MIWAREEAPRKEWKPFLPFLRVRSRRGCVDVLACVCLCVYVLERAEREWACVLVGRICLITFGDSNQFHSTCCFYCVWCPMSIQTEQLNTHRLLIYTGTHTHTHTLHPFTGVFRVCSNVFSCLWVMKTGKQVKKKNYPNMLAACSQMLFLSFTLCPPCLFRLGLVSISVCCSLNISHFLVASGFSL